MGLETDQNGKLAMWNVLKLLDILMIYEPKVQEPSKQKFNI